MATATSTLAIARKYLGTKESPTNSNNVIFNTSFYGKPVSGSAYPWCCVYFYEVCREAGVSVKKTASCAQMADWFKSQGRFYTSNPQPGDAVFFKFSGGSKNYTNHIGFVEKVQNGKIITIEGNTSTGNNCNGGMVMNRERTYPSPNIVGFGRPEYTSAPLPSATLTYPCRGVDISAYQENVSYMEFKRQNTSFAILKIIRKDLQPDKMFETHYRGFTDVGIPVIGVYNYSYATTVEKAKSDAAKVIEYLKGRKITVCLDVEDKCQQGMGKTLIEIVNAYGDVITNAGLSFVVYTGLSFFNSFFKPFLSFLKYKDFWIARYYNGYNPMSVDGPVNEAYKPKLSDVNVVGWQFTSSAMVPGMPKGVDANILYSAFGKIKNNTGTTYKNDAYNYIYNCKSLNIRTAPKRGSVVGHLKDGDLVTIYNVDFATGWYQIDKAGNRWISNSYVVSVTKAKLKSGINGLNIRSTDSKNGKPLGVYGPKDLIIILGRSETTGWYLTPKGWISDAYVKTQ